MFSISLILIKSYKNDKFDVRIKFCDILCQVWNRETDQEMVRSWPRYSVVQQCRRSSEECKNLLLGLALHTSFVNTIKNRSVKNWNILGFIITIENLTVATKWKSGRLASHPLNQVTVFLSFMYTVYTVWPLKQFNCFNLYAPMSKYKFSKLICTFHYKISWENLIKNQSIFPLVIILLIFITVV